MKCLKIPLSTIEKGEIYKICAGDLTNKTAIKYTEEATTCSMVYEEFVPKDR